MRTTDLFKNNRSAKKINESLEKTFGKKLNLENFDLHQLQDARNKLRTQVSQVRGESGFNENLENDALTQAQWMLDTINAEIGHREEFTIEATDGIETEDIQAAKALSLRYYDNVYVEDTPDGVMVYGEDIEGGFADRDGGEVDGYFNFAANLATGEIEITNHSEEGENDRWARQEDMKDIASDILGDIKTEYGETWEEISNELEGGMEVDDEGGETDDGYALASAGFGSDEDYESVDNEAYDMDQLRKDAANGIKKSIDKQSDDRIAKLKSDKNKGFMAKVGDKIIGGVKGAARGFSGKESEEHVDELSRGTIKSYAAKKIDRVKTDLPNTLQKVGKDLQGLKGARSRLKGEKPTSESVNTGDNMTNRLQEGEIQQAQSIVTAKTMVDRVGRWIEELSGMENDTLLQLGDQIRDEMGQEQAKGFISSVAPAIQSALETLKTTRESLASGMRTLTGEEQPANMLGDELPGDEYGGAADMDSMNPDMGPPMGGEEDAFAAAEPAAGGLGDAGREQRESIQYQNRLLKVLAG